MEFPSRVRVVDSHTGGEPTRVVVEGLPDLGGGTVAERAMVLATKLDSLMTGVVCEPRGSDVLVGAFLMEPSDPLADHGVVFFNNVGLLNMCGHGTIGVVETLRHMGKFDTGTVTLETPVGLVSATFRDDGMVEFNNVPAWRSKKAVTVEVEGHGPVAGDVAWGGNWFFLVSEHGKELKLTNWEDLSSFTWKIREALERDGVTGDKFGHIDHIEIFGPAHGNADSRNFVLCPGKAYDRSPCGTGTSAKLACLAADGKLAPGEIWRQESITGSVFEGFYRDLGDGTVRPTVAGRAWVTGESDLLFLEDDPFRKGIGGGL